MRKLILVTLGATLLLVASTHAAERPNELDAEIRKLLQLTGAGNLGATMAKNVIASFKSSFPKVPEEFWSEFEKDIKPEEVMELVVPVYAKHLTLEEIRAANAFYSTPEGRSMINKLPVIMTDAMQAGQQWGEKLGKQTVERLQEKGFMPKKG